MPSKPSGKSEIIIKKVKVRSHEGSHGGSWKVAYADFVTAMMAFFLLMWLLAMVSPERRAALSEYFTHFSIFEKAGMPMQSGERDSVPPSGIAEVAISEPAASAPPVNPTLLPQMQAEEQFKSRLREDIEALLGDLKDQVLVDSFENGVRVQVIDKEGSLMFPLGSAALTGNAVKALSVIAERLKTVDHKIAIEGHTDALTYPTSQYTNWELSTARASAARQELERFGVKQERLLRIAGFAAVEPLIRDDANDPRNRRISILVYDKSKGT
jgi:chemotaxis protein MotB